MQYLTSALEGLRHDIQPKGNRHREQTGVSLLNDDLHHRRRPISKERAFAASSVYGF